MTKTPKTKTTVKRKKKVIESNNWCQDYLPVAFEMQTHRQNLSLLTNVDLIDQVTYAIDEFKAKDIDVIYHKIHNSKEITNAERQKLEAFYILLNGDLGCQE